MDVYIRVYLGITVLNTSYFVYNTVMLFVCRCTSRYLGCLYKDIPIGITVLNTSYFVCNTVMLFCKELLCCLYVDVLAGT